MPAKLIVSISLLAVAVSLGVSYSVNAVRRAPDRAGPTTPTGPMGEDPLYGLDLTAEQRLNIEEQFRDFHPKLLALQAAADAKRAELAEAIVRAEGLSPEVDGCLREIARLEAELDREVAKTLLSLKPHLTAWQQSKLFRYIETRHSTNRR